jgi:hypothetical protein
MSDFDAVLERLLSEPAFGAALAADPAAALSGYRLDADEIELLRSQVSSDSGGGPAAVETRTNKSSTFGLFSAVADVGHALSADGPWSASGGQAGAAAQGFGDAPGAGGSGAGTVPATTGFGDAPAPSGFGAVPATSGFGDAPATSGFGDAPATTGFGPAPATSGFGDAAAAGGFGAAATAGLEEVGRSIGEAAHMVPPAGYHPHIDANGDGHWDRATFIGTKSDGVEILVDVNHDGHADFVGHDTNSDGLVDYADYDKDDNGTFEKRMYDDNGDGWLDRTVRHRND